MKPSIYEIALAMGAVAGVLLTFSSLAGRVKRLFLWAISPFTAHRAQVKAELLEIREARRAQAVECFIARFFGRSCRFIV